MSDLATVARDLIHEAAAKISPVEYLKRSVRAMPPGDVQELAVAYLLAQLKQRKRAVVRTVEQESTRPELSPEAIERFRRMDEERERESAERQRAFWDDMNAAFDRYKQALRVEWTRELLGSEFGLGDGTVTTWGFATVEQHEARIAMHKRNAVAGMEGAARHMQAVETLRETGALCLNQAVKVAA